MMDFPSKIPITGLSPFHQHICDKYDEFMDWTLSDFPTEIEDEEPEDFAWTMVTEWFRDEHGINISDDCKFFIISTEEDYLAYSQFLLEFG